MPVVHLCVAMYPLPIASHNAVTGVTKGDGTRRHHLRRAQKLEENGKQALEADASKASLERVRMRVWRGWGGVRKV